MSERIEDRPNSEQYEHFLHQFTRDRDRLYAYVCSLVINRADAEDIFQQCSIVLWRKYATFQRNEDFLAWACGVAHYEVRNYLRMSGRSRLQFDSELVDQLAAVRLDSLAHRDQRLAALRLCLEALSAEQRSLLDQAYGSGTIKQWAQSSGKALQTAYNRLSRLRRQLHVCVQSKMKIEPLP